MEKSLLNLYASDKDIGKIIESMENRSLMDDISPLELLGVAMDIYISGNGEEKTKTTTAKKQHAVKKPDTKTLPKIQEAKAAVKKIKKVVKPADKKEEMPQVTEAVPPTETQPAPEVKKTEEIIETKNITSAAKTLDSKSSIPIEKMSGVKPISLIPKTFDAKMVSQLKKSVELKKISPISKITVKPIVSGTPKTFVNKTVLPVKNPVISPEASLAAAKPAEVVKAETPVAAVKPIEAAKADKPETAVKTVEVVKAEAPVAAVKPIEVAKADKPETAVKTAEVVKAETPVAAVRPIEAAKADKPETAVKTVEVVKAEAPVAAVKPIEAAKADKPETAVKTVEVVKAETPVAAVKPIEVAKADKPTVPVKPAETAKTEEPEADLKPIEVGKADIALKVSEPVKTRTVKRIKKIIRKIRPATKDGQPRTVVEETIIETIPHTVEEKPKISEGKILENVAAPVLPLIPVLPVIPVITAIPLITAIPVVPVAIPVPEPKPEPKPEVEKATVPPSHTDDDLVSFALGLFSSSTEDQKIETIDEGSVLSVPMPESVTNPALQIFDGMDEIQPPHDMDLLDTLMNPSAPIFTDDTEEKASATSEEVSQPWASDTISPIEEMLAAAGMFTEEEDPPKQMEKTRLGAHSLTAAPVQKPAEKVQEEHFLSSDDWMSIIDGKTPPQTVESTAAVTPAIEKAIPVPTPGLAEQEAEAPEFVSPDDWMDMMEGKEAGAGAATATAEEAAAVELGYALKDAPDYAAKHELPERQELKIKEKTPTRDGMRKKEMFYQTKVSFKSRFGSSTKKPGKICSICGKGEKANSCVSCGNSEATFMTRVCDKCSGDKKVYNKCITCGRPNAKVIGRLCENCRSMARSCVICGKKV